MQFADPSAFVKPTFVQVLADLVTAEFLMSHPVEAAPYGGRPALDAAVAKLQQAAEKALQDLISPAQAQPGMKAVMEVYGQWQTLQNATEPYRRAMEQRDEIMLTNWG